MSGRSPAAPRLGARTSWNTVNRGPVGLYQYLLRFLDSTVIYVFLIINLLHIFFTFTQPCIHCLCVHPFSMRNIEFFFDGLTFPCRDLTLIFFLKVLLSSWKTSRPLIVSPHLPKVAKSARTITFYLALMKTDSFAPMTSILTN